MDDPFGKIVNAVKSVSSLIRLIDVTFACHRELTCPPQLPGQQTNDNVCWDAEVAEQMAPPQWAISSAGPFKMSTMICSL